MTGNRHSKLKLFGLFVLGFILISGTVDLDNLFNYSNQAIPDYIPASLDNTPLNNQMDDAISTLGRVLFYDKKLSSDNSVSCASCHAQENAFGLVELQGAGVNGLSLRRPMRLGNLRYRELLEGFFWDERTSTLEDLATQPIQDHIEMGYSGENGAPDINDLILEMEEVDYYDQLFTFAFGDNAITEDRMAKALAQFLRSIQSYDARFDTGYAAVGGNVMGDNLTVDFPNFSSEENLGKLLFLTDPVLEGGARVAGGVGCFHCHSAPNFHFLIELHNNGVITEIEGGEVLDITKAPSLRDVFGPDGTLNGPLFHNGQASTFDELLDHYNNVSLNSELDFRIVNNGIPLNLTAEERLQLEAFIKTLTGADIYSNEMWSDPFDENGSIEIIGGPNGLSSFYNNGDLTLYPNPVQDRLFLKGIGSEVYSYTISDALGKVIASGSGRLADGIDIAELEAGSYSITVFDVEKKFIFSQKFLK